MLKALDHLEIIVRNVDEYVKFLQGLGFELKLETKHHGKSVELSLPGEGQPIIELHEPSPQEVIGINHVAFSVDDMDAACEKLRALGMQLQSGPYFYPPSGRTLANFRDPDGHRWQLVGPKREEARGEDGE